VIQDTRIEPFTDSTTWPSTPVEGPSGQNTTTVRTPIEALADARWIWTGSDPRPVNTTALFRREFEVEIAAKSADVLIYSEWRYRLFVNGRFVQVGPTPCQPSHKLVDRIDITHHLNLGTNSVAVAVYTPGTMTGQWTLVNPALIAILGLDGISTLTTDHSWRGIISSAWQHPTQFCGYAKGFHEWHVLSKMPDGWTSPGFDDVAWSAATELPNYPTGEVEENYIGYPTLQLHRPKQYLTSGLADGTVTDEMCGAAAGYYTAARTRWWRLMGMWHTSYSGASLEETAPEPISERMHHELHIATPANMVQSSESEDGLPLNIQVPDSGTGDTPEHPFVVFDFGVVRSGLLHIEVESISGGTVDIGWDDRVEDGRVAVGRTTPNVDRVELPPGRHVWTSLFERGLRFMQISFRGFSGEVTIYKAGVVETLTPIRATEPARFESDDDVLNRIWRAAAETTRLYMNGCAAGDPCRERAHWFCDDGLSMRMAFVLYGEKATWRRALELTAEAQNTDGSIPVVSPGHFEDCNMVMGSCMWAVSIAEYVHSTGDSGFAVKMFDHIRRHIAYEFRFADGDGLLYETPGRRFLSWADSEPRTPYAPGETWAKTSRKPWGDFFDPPTRGWNAIINAAWLYCLRESVILAREIGETTDAIQWESAFSRGRDAFDRKFYVHDTGLWRDNVTIDVAGNLNEPTYCESTLFTMMRTGLVDREAGLSAIEKIMALDFVCCRTSGGLEGSAYPVFLMNAGRTDDALAYWLDRWGAPVLAGATTCGEEFFRGLGNSDCHIHGAGPAREFIEHLGGINIRAAQWDEVLLTPPADGAQLPDLTASVPTPHGQIATSVETDATGRWFRWTLPEGCRGYLRTDAGDVEVDSRECRVPLRRV
jgi:alpha-L-rhamnosidase